MFITIMHIKYIICIFHIIIHFFSQVRRHIVHTLVGGGGQHGGYDALDYRKIHQGNAGKLGNYPILSVLPDKFARFLFEYHSHRFESLDLPLLPADRSDFDVHGALLDDKVQNKMSYPAVYYVLSNATLVLSIITIMTVIYIILEQRISRQIYAFFQYTLHCFLGIAVRTPGIGRVDLCSSPMGGSNLTRKNGCNYIF